MPLPAAGPSQSELASILDGLQRQIAGATDASSLKQLTDQLALAREWARRMRLAFDGQNRFAELELRSARRLGEILRITVRPGRPQKRSGGSTDCSRMLPDGVTRDRSSKCQRIAAIESGAFERFIDECKQQGVLISERRALRTFAKIRSRPSTGGRPRDVGARTSGTLLPSRTVDAVRRLMKVDVLVGGPLAAFDDADVVTPETLDRDHLRGDVFVARCPRPHEWLPRLAAYRELGAFSQAIVMLPATPGARWFRQLENGGWSCCFEDEGSLAMAYIGPRRHGFRVAFHEIGTVLHGHSIEA